MWRLVVEPGENAVSALNMPGLSRTRMVAMLVGMALALSLCGCESSGDKAIATTAEQTPVVAPLEHPLLKGIPVPAGFTIVRERSRARNMGGTRVAQCEFQGSLIPSEVVRFYEHYMPTAHFRPGSKIFVQGAYTLRFESDSEECVVFTKRNLFNTALMLDVGPVSKGGIDATGGPTPPSP
jgi:hypothetical protein